MKYRQHGYRDSERESEAPRRPPQERQLTDEERIQRRSMRKATDREANEVARCHVCGRVLPEFLGPIVHESVCSYCTAPLHCCRACTHFDTSVRWQCRAEIQAPIPDKNKPNRCALFRPRLVLDFTGRRGSTRETPASNDPRAQFESLFKR